MPRLQVTFSSHSGHDFVPYLPKVEGPMREEILPNGDYNRSQCASQTQSFSCAPSLTLRRPSQVKSRLLLGLFRPRFQVTIPLDEI